MSQIRPRVLSVDRCSLASSSCDYSHLLTIGSWAEHIEDDKTLMKDLSVLFGALGSRHVAMSASNDVICTGHIATKSRVNSKSLVRKIES